MPIPAPLAKNPDTPKPTNLAQQASTPRPRTGCAFAPTPIPGIRPAPTGRIQDEVAPKHVLGNPGKTDITRKNTIFGQIGSFFKKEVKGLADLTNASAKTLRDTGTAVAQKAAGYARQPRKLLAESGTFLKTSAGNTRAYASRKITQFKSWYATPEGKAAFWKGITLTGVGLLTVASAGTLTAPALMLAGAVSAAGGVAAQAVHNQVFNAAAAKKARQETAYAYTPKTALQGVSLKTMAVDGAVGAFGGPLARFAGKAVIGSVGALARGALPALKGTAQLGMAAARTGARRLLSPSQRAALKAAGNSVKGTGSAIKSGAQHTMTGFKNHVGDPLNGFVNTQKAKAARSLTSAGATVKNSSPGHFVRRQAQSALDKKNGAIKALRRNVTAWRVEDLRLLRGASSLKAVRAVRAANTTANHWLAGAGKVLNNLKNVALDKIDNAGHKIGRSWKTSKAGQLVQGQADGFTRYVDRVIGTSNNPNLVKAFNEFRESSQAIRAHLTQTWSEAGQELTVGYGRLFGQQGAAQAEMRQLVGTQPMYASQLDAAKAAAKARLAREIEEDGKKLARRALLADGITNPRAEQVRSRMNAMGFVQRARTSLDARAEREASKFVARHASEDLRKATLAAYQAEGVKKVLVKFFGSAASRQGLIARSGYVVSSPVRFAVKDRLDKYVKIASTLRGATPIAGMAQLLESSVAETAEKTVRDQLNLYLKTQLKTFLGEEEGKKPSKSDDAIISKVVQEGIQEVMPINPDDFVKDLQKNMQIKEEE
ncbi:hypothetical protein [Deinococcus peraridilitoris]|uniref:hypothetical protein n=1 Tax=Deinococcus peraridilitoris TaxID=432329 RepID=UPI00059CC4E6|nr:hypothetical protein [Deinococcus peraridilitoris]